MYKHILIATDGFILAKKAEETGLALAKALNSQVTAVTVSEPWESWSLVALAERSMPNPAGDYDECVAAAAKRILHGVGVVAKQLGVACRTLHIRNKCPAEGIVEAARELGCDLIVLASHGRRGLSKLILGSQTTRVVTLSPVPVLVCR